MAQNYEFSQESLQDVMKQFEAEAASLQTDPNHGKAPLDVLPLEFRALIEQLQQHYKFPPDYSLLYLLFAFSVAIGNNYRIKVKDNWIEPAILYMALVAPAGQTKTPVQTFFTRPFKEWDRKNFEDYSKKLADFEAAKQASSKSNPCLLTRPTRSQLLLQDYTPEALVKVLSENWHGVGVMTDELAGFFGNMNRYNRGNEVPMWLSFFNAQSFSSNRKTSQDFYVAHPYVSIIGGIQPAILKKLFVEEMQVNGMSHRFLFVYNRNIRKEIPSDEEVQKSLIEAYINAIKFLLSIEPVCTDDRLPTVLPIEADAKKLLFEYLQINTDKFNDATFQGLDHLASMYSKFDYHVVRLSFILQLLTDASNRVLPTTLTATAVIGGARLCDYFKVHSLMVQNLISATPIARYDEAKKTLYRQLPNDVFTFSEAVSISMCIRQHEIEHGGVKPDAVEKWTQRFLQQPDLFRQPKTGHYIKKTV